MWWFQKVGFQGAQNKPISPRFSRSCFRCLLRFGDEPPLPDSTIFGSATKWKRGDHDNCDHSHSCIQYHAWRVRCPVGTRLLASAHSATRTEADPRLEADAIRWRPATRREVRDFVSTYQRSRADEIKERMNRLYASEVNVGNFTALKPNGGEVLSLTGKDGIETSASEEPIEARRTLSPSH